MIQIISFQVYYKCNITIIFCYIYVVCGKPIPYGKNPCFFSLWKKKKQKLIRRTEKPFLA